MANLSDATAKAAKRGSVARDLADGTVPGLALRVLPSGAKAWALRAKIGGQRVRIDLGRYPYVTVKDARVAAGNALRVIERGDDPRYEGCTVAEAVKDWLEAKHTNRSLANERRRFDLHVLPTLGTVGVRAVKAEVLARLLHKMAHGANAKPVEANRVYTSLRGLFRWCRKNKGCPDDPTALLDKPTKEEPSAVRRREGTEPLLSLEELAKLWNAAPSLGGSVLSDRLRCLLLLPLRREELTGLRWDEIRESFVADGWTGAALCIPASRMKGRRPAVVPLPSSVVEIIESRRKLTGRGAFVFAVPGHDKAFGGWRRGADTLREALGERIDWSPHTIRASVATSLVRDLGGEELLVGRILQHSARSVLGVTDTYQRSSRMAEQAELLARWSGHLQAVAAALAAPNAKDRVVPLPVPTARRARLSHTAPQ